MFCAKKKPKPDGINLNANSYRNKRVLETGSRKTQREAIINNRHTKKTSSPRLVLTPELQGDVCEILV
jgi:hypothetical protein